MSKEGILSASKLLFTCDKDCLSDCNYYINNSRATSSNLVTPTKSPNFQTLCFLPFFKAGQGFQTPQKQNQHNLVTFQYQPLIPYYNQKCGHL